MGLHEDFLNKQLREKEEDQRLYEQTLKDLRTEERFVNALKAYNAESVKRFVEYYAKQKVSWHRYGGVHERYAAQKLQQERDNVVRLLKHIMEKKVFDLKCRWVAGEMDIDGIATSGDFTVWESNAELLKVVGPIKADEFYCYLEWYERGSPERLNEYGYAETSGFNALRFFHHMRSSYAKGSMKEVPEWFHEYDRHFGTAPLLTLPTTRRDMEEDHLDLWMKDIHYASLTPEQQKYCRPLNRSIRKRLMEDPVFAKEWHEEGSRLFKEQQAGKPQYESFSVYNHKLMEEIVSAIETREVQESYRYNRRWYDIREQDDMLFTEIQYLKDVEEYVAVPAYEDYRESLKEAYREHSRQTTQRALTLLFEEYEECQRTGSLFDWGPSNRDYGMDEERNRILAVRKLKGLPENFDFLKKENLP